MKQTIFTRIRNLVLADLHHVLDEKERENPVAMLNQYVREAEHEVQTIEQLVKRHRLLQESFLQEQKQAQFMANKRKEQAEIAKKAEVAVLVERAMQEAKYYEEQAQRFTDLHEQTKEQVQELEQRLAELKQKLKEMALKRMELMARENVAHIQHRITAAGHQNPRVRFEAIERRMQELELRAHENYEYDAIDYEIARLGQQKKESV